MVAGVGALRGPSSCPCTLPMGLPLPRGGGWQEEEAEAKQAEPGMDGSRAGTF